MDNRVDYNELVTLSRQKGVRRAKRLVDQSERQTQS